MHVCMHGSSHRCLQKKEGYTVGPVLLAFFLFVVVGSGTALLWTVDGFTLLQLTLHCVLMLCTAILQIIRTAQTGV